MIDFAIDTPSLSLSFSEQKSDFDWNFVVDANACFDRIVNRCTAAKQNQNYLFSTAEKEERFEKKWKNSWAS